MFTFKAKRGRGKNFSEREKRIFSEIINEDKFRTVLENKKTDIETNKLKTETWIEIRKIFNRQTDEEERTVYQLKTYYDNLKRRKKCPAEGVMSDNGERVFLEIIQPHVDIINNDKPEFNNIKKMVWELITNEYNSKVVRKQDTVSLIELYRDHKQRRLVNRIDNSQINERNSSEQDEFKPESLDSTSPYAAGKQTENEYGLLTEIKMLPESPNVQNNTDDDILLSDHSEQPSQREIDSCRISCEENYYMLKNQLLRIEIVAKNKEMEHKKLELQEKLNIYILERRIKEQELKLKEIETNIKLEEWKKIMNDKYVD